MLNDQTQSIALASGTTLEMLDIKRYLPGRRLVGSCLWNGQPVYAKVFWGKDAEKYQQRDQQGIQRLMAAKIATPKLLLAEAGIEGSHVLLLEEIANAENLDTVWNTLPGLSTQRLLLAKQLVGVVANHHRYGLMQTDLYLKNFILMVFLNLIFWMSNWMHCINLR